MRCSILVSGEAEPRPEIYETTTHAVQAYMRTLLDSGNRDLTNPVAYVVIVEDGEHCRMVAQDNATERQRRNAVPTCLNGVCLVYDADATKAFADSQVANFKFYNWLNLRSRFASVSIDFDKSGTYKCHRVTWHNELGWCSAEGQSLSEAIDRAMRTTINLKTGEYHVPKEAANV